MNIKIHHKESLQLADGKQSILTIKELPTGELEVSLKSIKNNDIINVNKYFTNKTEALIFMEYLRSECYAPRIDMDYEQLTIDIKLAVDFAKECIDNTMDINLENRYQDTLCLILDGWNGDKAISAISSVGLYCRQLKRASQDMYYYLPVGQGFHTEMAELMDKYMQALGYHAYVNYALD